MVVNLSEETSPRPSTAGQGKKPGLTVVATGDAPAEPDSAVQQAEDDDNSSEVAQETQSGSRCSEKVYITSRCWKPSDAADNGSKNLDVTKYQSIAEGTSDYVSQSASASKKSAEEVPSTTEGHVASDNSTLERSSSVLDKQAAAISPNDRLQQPQQETTSQTNYTVAPDYGETPLSYKQQPDMKSFIDLGGSEFVCDILDILAPSDTYISELQKYTLSPAAIVGVVVPEQPFRRREVYRGMNPVIKLFVALASPDPGG